MKLFTAISAYARIALYCVFLFLSCSLKSEVNNPNHNNSHSVLKIGFGSCADQKSPQPIWKAINQHQPDLFIFMGDNIYPTNNDFTTLTQSYQQLAEQPHFAKLKRKTPLMATWDDNDYAKTDGGKANPAKFKAKKALINFFNYPELNALKDQDIGIYHARTIKFEQKSIQIILLDTRWYRDDLTRSYLNAQQKKSLKLGPYQPSSNTNATLLGQQQWAWLRQQLQQPADLRIIVSSIQVLNEFSGWESWANLPHERERLLNLLHQFDKQNILLLSGDMHRSEISKYEFKQKQFIEVTGSPLASKTYPVGINQHRVGNAYNQVNYGLLEITTAKTGHLEVTASIYDINGQQQLVAKLGE
ncbi:alkaline phosphatase D family protein [Aliikangiella sp. IMCC44632]